jgi:hypothetical protein
VSNRIAVLMKMAGVATLCFSLTGCQLFCACATILALNTGDSFVFFDECAVGGFYVCPWTGVLNWTDAYGNPMHTPCIPGTINPLGPSLLAPEAVAPPSSTASSAVAQDVEASLTGLPQAPPRSQRVLTPSPPARIDCTDPANAGRGPCAGTYRQDKPLLPPGD